MKADLVVFDMAGTTVYDGDAVRSCFEAALATANVPLERDAITRVMGIRKPDAIRMLLTDGRGSAPGESEVQARHADFVRRMLEFYANDPAVREVPGARKTFDTLRKQGVRVALDTGFSRDIVDAIVKRLNWADAVDATIASDEVPQGRPHPDMIRTLMAKLGIADSARVAKVGDTIVDLEEGSNTGCGFVIGVLSGACSREQLAAAPHTHIVDSIVDVPDLLR